MKDEAVGGSAAGQQVIPETRPGPRWHEIISIGVVILDHKARILHVNSRAARMFGFTTDWLRRRSFLVFVGPEYVIPFLDLLKRNGATRTDCTMDLDLVVQNYVVPVRLHLSSIEQDSHQIEFIDIPTEREAETNLRRSLFQWQSLVRNAPDIVMTLDRDGNIAFINAPLWGYSIPAVTNTSFYQYIPGPAVSKVARCMGQAFRGRRSQCEIVTGKNDAQRHFNLSFGPSRVQPGDMRKDMVSTVIIRDITEHKRVETELRDTSRKYEQLATRMETVLEEERARLSREIHDDLGQLLTILKLDLSLMRRELPGKATLRQKFEGVINRVDEVIEKTQDISTTLRPSILDDIGLIAAIEWQVRQIQERTGLHIHIDHSGEKIIAPPQFSDAVFRVVQESLTNIVRHSEATEVFIRIVQTPSAVRISIHDDGRGIRAEEVRDSRSLGILGMKERIARLRGTFRIFAAKGKGTTIKIAIPLQKIAAP